MLEILKKSGFMSALVGTIVAGSALLAPGCSGGDDDDDATTGDDDDATEDTSPTPTATPAPTGSVVTFTVDTTQMADGVNKLAEVLDGEQVFMVGYFNAWDPQDTDYELVDDGTGGDATADDGIFTIQLTFPLEGFGTDSEPYTWQAGDTGFEYKFAKTAAGDNVWSNSLKDYKTVLEAACPTAELDDLGGLHQIDEESGNSTINAGHNIYLEEIPAEDTTITYVAEAWETYALETFDLPLCN